MQSSRLLIATHNGDGFIYSWDLENGSLTPRFKGNDSARQGLCKLGNDYIVAAQTNKHSLHTWDMNKEQVLQRSITAEAITALAASPGGAFLAGGSSSGTLYLWETASGRLLQTWAAHYKGITCLLFVGGSSLLLSGGEDTMVAAWLLPDLLDPALDPAGAGAAGAAGMAMGMLGGGAAARPQPLQAWADHTLPVTALAAGMGEAAAALVASAAQDRTVKLRRLADGCVVRSVALPAGVESILMDAGEQFLFAGCSDGAIYRVLLGGDEDGDAVAAAGPGHQQSGSGSGSGSGTDPAGHSTATFTGHTRAVTCLALASLPDRGGAARGWGGAAGRGGVGGGGGGGGGAQVLVSGSDDGTVRVWDMLSRLPIQTISTPGKEPVSSLLLLPPSARRGPGGPGGDAAGLADQHQPHHHVGAGGGGGCGGRQPATRRAQPIATFSKYLGTRTTSAQRWEGCPVILAPTTTTATTTAPGDTAAGGSSGGGDLCPGHLAWPAPQDTMGLPAALSAVAAGGTSLGGWLDGMPAATAWEVVLGAAPGAAGAAVSQ